MNNSRNKTRVYVDSCIPITQDEWTQIAPGLRKIYALEAAASDPKLSAGDKSVLTWISSYSAAGTWISYPSHSTLARLTQLSRRAVINSIERLIRFGYVEIIE